MHILTESKSIVYFFNSSLFLVVIDWKGCIWLRENSHFIFSPCIVCGQNYCFPNFTIFEDMKLIHINNIFGFLYYFTPHRIQESLTIIYNIYLIKGIVYCGF